MDQDAKASILDLPNRTLSPDLWDHTPGQLPRLKPDLRSTILKTACSKLGELGMPDPYAVHLYGGAASYQWHHGSDIDVSVYSEWKEGSLPHQEEFIKTFKQVEIPYGDYVVHLYLKPPEQHEPYEVADSYYDIIHDSWVVTPLELPENFDPEKAFAPLIAAAEKKAERFDLALGLLRRSIRNYKKTREQLDTSRDREVAENRLLELRTSILKLMKSLVSEYEILRKNREVLHTQLRLKPEKRESRFAEAEIVWKYLDRYGYNDVLHLIKSYLDSSKFEVDFQ